LRFPLPKNAILEFDARKIDSLKIKARAGSAEMLRERASQGFSDRGWISNFSNKNGMCSEGIVSEAEIQAASEIKKMIAVRLLNMI